MYKYIFLLSALTGCCISYELESLTGTPIEQCINCICYAKTGTWDIRRCGYELLTDAYWRTAGSLTTSSDRRPEIARRSCIEDVNCILTTIKRYTEQFGFRDLNLDGKFNCQDRFGIQISENICVNRESGLAYFDRFYSCLPYVIKSEARVGDNQNVGGNNQNGGGRYQNGGVNNQNRGGSNQNEGGNNQNRGGSNQNEGGNNQNGGGRYQNGGVNNQNRGGSNQNEGGNNQNGRRNNQNRAQVNQDIAVLVQQNVNGNNKVQQNVGLITSQTSRGNVLEEDPLIGRNLHDGRNNQNRGGNNQNVVRSSFQQTVIGSNNNVGQNVAVVASQTSGGNTKQGVNELQNQQNVYYSFH